MKQDIQTLDDIKLMVNTFYGRIQKNEVLGPIFEEKLDGRWEQHLEKMYRFWQTILFDEHTYSGAPFPPHANMPIDESHFVIWVQNWTGIVDEFFTGPTAEEAKKRGTLMAAIFNSKLEFFKKNGL
ncbi:MAG: group III truncated hemoglobin [Bacteroidia bacterium]|jgi:hemoglobin|nr:group III truncated hemoglobin [Bacteroidia bacterium]